MRRSADRRKSARTSFLEPRGLGGRWQSDELRFDLCTRSHPNQPAHHDILITLQALANDTIAVELGTGPNRLGRYGPCVVDDKDDAAVEIRADRLVRQKNAGMGK